MRFDPSAELDAVEAQRIIREIINNGVLIISRHAKTRMVERGYTTHDIEHILLHGSITKKEINTHTNNWVYTVRGFDLEGDEGGVVAAISCLKESIVITVLS